MAKKKVPYWQQLYNEWYGLDDAGNPITTTVAPKRH